MIRLDRSALICDFAETYGIYDMGLLPAQLVATLASGLRADSRIKMKINGAKVPNDILLLAHAVDRLSLLVWQNTKDGQRNRNRPESIAERILNGEPKRYKCSSFDSPDDFWEARKRILKGGD